MKSSAARKVARIAEPVKHPLLLALRSRRRVKHVCARQRRCRTCSARRASVPTEPEGIIGWREFATKLRAVPLVLRFEMEHLARQRCQAERLKARRQLIYNNGPRAPRLGQMPLFWQPAPPVPTAGPDRGCGYLDCVIGAAGRAQAQLQPMKLYRDSAQKLRTVLAFPVILMSETLRRLGGLAPGVGRRVFLGLTCQK